MTTEALRASERIRGAKERKAKRERTLAWRADFRSEQSLAKERAEILVCSGKASKTHLVLLTSVIKNRRGPRGDQVELVGKLWVKYGFAGKKND